MSDRKTSDDGEAAPLVRALFAAVEANDIEHYLTFFAEDAEYTIGNNPPLTGAAGIREVYSQVMQRVRRSSHRLKDVWSAAQGIILCHADVIYERRDGTTVEVPSLAIIRLKDGKIAKYQAFIDTNPVFASSA